MAAIKFFNLLAISTLAILASLSAVPSANALTIHGASQVGNLHHRVAKRIAQPSSQGRKRDIGKRCAARAASTHAAATSSAAAAASSATSSAAATTSADEPKTTSQAAATTTTKKASTTTSSKAVASSAVSKSNGSGCSGKRGLAWSNHEADLIPQFTTNDVCWLYDWQADLEYGMSDKGLNFITMLWGTKNEADFASVAFSGKYNYAAGMNEPDISSQSNLSPADGVTLWNKYFCSLKSQGVTVLSPATAAGVSWLQQFKDGGACDWDITAVHVYTTTVDSFTSAVSAYRTFNKPIMVTEFSCNDYSGKNQQCDSDQIWSFLTGVMNWMDSQGDILAYFFFAPMTASELEANNINGANALITSDASGLTALGKFYIGS